MNSQLQITPMNSTLALQAHNLPIADYQIVHATIGRFRLRIPRFAQDSSYSKRLEDFVRSLKFVTEVRINRMVCSLIVYYETSQVSMATVQAKLIEAIQQISRTTKNWGAELNGFRDTDRVGEHSSIAQRSSQSIAVVKPPKDKMVWITWLALFPLVTGVSFLLEPWLIFLSLPLRTLLMTGIVVPLMVYFVMPLMTEIFQEWLST
jgi:hypothetical protein